MAIKTTPLTTREGRLLVFATCLMRAVTDTHEDPEIQKKLSQMHLEWAQSEWKLIRPTVPRDLRKRMSKTLSEYKKAVKRSLT